ncbi:hypothetical protein HanRHA438_Chr14g0639661 [Helianthus annuus]|nr:hypothetical protein HanRHA438_Chr14g0639661 [Helianthus annuus]
MFSLYFIIGFCCYFVSDLAIILWLYLATYSNKVEEFDTKMQKQWHSLLMKFVICVCSKGILNLKSFSFFGCHNKFAVYCL